MLPPIMTKIKFFIYFSINFLNYDMINYFQKNKFLPTLSIGDLEFIQIYYT